MYWFSHLKYIVCKLFSRCMGSPRYETWRINVAARANSSACCPMSWRSFDYRLRRRTWPALASSTTPASRFWPTGWAWPRSEVSHTTVMCTHTWYSSTSCLERLLVTQVVCSQSLPYCYRPYIRVYILKQYRLFLLLNWWDKCIALDYLIYTKYAPAITW